jgi:hypothetical protein
VLDTPCGSGGRILGGEYPAWVGAARSSPLCGKIRHSRLSRILRDHGGAGGIGTKPLSPGASPLCDRPPDR